MASDRHIEELFDQFVGGDGQATNSSGDDEVIGVKHHGQDQFSFGDITNFGQKLFGGGDKKGGLDIGSLISQGKNIIGGGGGGGGGGDSHPAADVNPPEPGRKEQPNEPSAGASGGSSILDGVLGPATDFVTKNAALSGILGLISGTKDSDAQKKWIGSFANKLVSDQGATAMAFILKKFQGNKGDSTVGKIISSAIGKKEEQMPKGSEEQKYLASVNERLQSDPTDPQLENELARILVKNDCAPPGGEFVDEEESFEVKYVKRD